MLVRNQTDVTERQKAEEELQAVDRRKNQFLAMLGHELRNPLAAIRSAADLIMLSAPRDAFIERAHHVLERQSSHMARLIDGLLDVSRIAHDKLEIECTPVDLRSVIGNVVDDCASIAPEGVSLQRLLPDEPVWVRGDATRLAQVFENLVGNAQKFTPPPGTITVALETSEGCATVSVQDTGIGISPENLSIVFEAFQQSASGSQPHSAGLGLGLALARRLVEMQGGSLSARSEGPGRGAEFVVCLPLLSAAEVIPSAELDRTPEPAKKRVLLVEDNFDAREMLAELLEMKGHEVAAFGERQDALAWVRNHPVDVILCDIGLPDISGYEVARAIRAEPSLQSTRLVALIGYCQAEDRQRTERAGFNDYLVKPVDVSALEALLESA